MICPQRKETPTTSVFIHFACFLFIDTTTRWIYIVGLLLVPIVGAFGTNLSQMLLTRIGVQMKSMASEALYRKALTLSSTAKGKTSTGQVVNIMSTDTNNVFSVLPRSKGLVANVHHVRLTSRNSSLDGILFVCILHQ